MLRRILLGVALRGVEGVRATRGGDGRRGRVEGIVAEGGIEKGDSCRVGTAEGKVR